MLAMFPPCRGRVRALFGDCKGVTAIEYGLIAGLIMLAIMAGVTAIGTDLNHFFGTIVAGHINSAGR